LTRVHLRARALRRGVAAHRGAALRWSVAWRWSVARRWGLGLGRGAALRWSVARRWGLALGRDAALCSGAALLCGASLSAAAFAGEAASLQVRSLAATCAACHGTDGAALRGSAIPRLAGLPRDYLVRRMRAFRDGLEPATVMQQIAKGFSDAQTAELAAYFEQQPQLP
jgi:cytochrome c553